MHDVPLQDYVQYSRVPAMEGDRDEIGAADPREDGTSKSLGGRVEGTGGRVRQANHGMYAEALDKYPTDESIDKVAERRLVRRLDLRILPLLGICYFFYV